MKSINNTFYDANFQNKMLARSNNFFLSEKVVSYNLDVIFESDFLGY